MPFDYVADAAEIADLMASAQAELTGIMFPHRCDLWKITTPTIDPVTKVLQDADWVAAGTNILCRLLPTPEANEPEIIGRARIDNYEILDIFHFQSGVNVSDGDCIVFRTAGDNLNRAWIVQGNPKALTPDPFRPIAFQLVLATNTTVVPAGITI